MLAETVTVWVNSGRVPERAVWEGVQYRVTDTPTPLDLNINFVTHVPFLPKGWRFQGTNEQGDSLIFDVVSVSNGQTWRVLNTYR